jgi:hypothetical protein
LIVTRIAEPEAVMPKLRIEVFEDGSPSATITIPSWLFAAASRMLPRMAGRSLQDRIDLEQLIALASDPDASGVIIDIEDHQDKERVVISVIADAARSAA